MTRVIELATIELPSEDDTALPAIPAAEYERRIEDLLKRVDTDWVAVYGDPEHRGNLIYLCGFDPRFEEALVVLGLGGRFIVVGTEGRDFAHPASIDLTSLWVPTFSCAGIDRTQGMSLADALAAAGVTRGQRVGVVGWKVVGRSEWTATLPAIAAPAFVVDALRVAVGESGQVVDRAALLLDAQTGRRFAHGADQIAQFEWGARQAATAVRGIVAAAAPGKTEAEIASGMRYAGAPLSYHPVVASGPDLPAVLGSPRGRVTELGDPIFAMVGGWGGNSARGGMLAADERDCGPSASGYLEEVVIPYWRAVVAWYESVRLGETGSSVLRRVTEICEQNGFGPAIGIGHYVDWEDWPNTPFRPDSDATIRSGMVIDCDIFSTENGPGHIVHCEDTVAVADEALRADIATRYPAAWGRFRRRQVFMRESLGIELPEEILPLTPLAGYLAPFWLRPALALRARSQ